MRAVRAVPLDSFNPGPNSNDPRSPWVRLADYMSEHAGRTVEVREIGVFPGTFALLRAATRVWAMLQGLPADAADSLATGRCLRGGNLIPAGFAYVVAGEEERS